MGASDNKKSYMKWYREKNKEKLKKYQDKYNVGYYKKIRAEKIECICGGCFIKRNKKSHETARKHINFCKKNGLKYYDYIEVEGEEAVAEKKIQKNLLEKNNIESIYNSLYG
jgi:hypothetical protein